MVTDVGRPPTKKERQEAHAAESAKISRRIADGDDFPEAGRVWRALAKMKSAKPHVTGITALNIPTHGRIFADWHSYVSTPGRGRVRRYGIPPT